MTPLVTFKICQKLFILLEIKFFLDKEIAGKKQPRISKMLPGFDTPYLIIFHLENYLNQTIMSHSLSICTSLKINKLIIEEKYLCVSLCIKLLRRMNN